MENRTVHKDLINEFRRNVNTLLNNGKNKTDLINMSKITYVTFNGLLLKDIIDIKLQTSTMVKIQNFNKKVIHDVSSIRLLRENELEKKLLSDEEVAKEMKRLNGDKNKNPIFDKAVKEIPVMGKENFKYPGQEEIKEPASLKDKCVGDPLTEEELEFYKKLGEAYKLKPINCVITINLY